ncbi:MAG: DUF2066 domain-containing protein [Alphaproteobacteria bacterium]|nr:DUF2066 domain-containing protein [Alphaproteobacteria bacterium]
MQQQPNIPNVGHFAMGCPFLVRRLGALAMVASLAFPSVPRAQDSAFVVARVAVDVMAESAASARDQAVADGQKQALDRLLRRLVLRSDYGLLPRVDAALVSALVLDFEVENERTSSKRYLAYLTVRFKGNEVRNLLGDAGLSFSETVARPRLVLPILETSGTAYLWEDPNPWREAWMSRPLDGNSPYPYAFARGDSQDQSILGLAPAGRGDDQRVLALAARYNFREVVVVRATLDADPATSRPRLQVNLRAIGAAVAAAQFSVIGESRDRLAPLFADAVERSIMRLEEDWKRDNLLRLDSLARLSVSVPIEALPALVEIRRRLAGAPIVKRVDVSAVSKVDAQLILHFYGDPPQLVGALAQRDLLLTQRDGYWTLTQSEAVVRTGPAR